MEFWTQIIIQISVFFIGLVGVYVSISSRLAQIETNISWIVKAIENKNKNN